MQVCVTRPHTHDSDTHMTTTEPMLLFMFNYTSCFSVACDVPYCLACNNKGGCVSCEKGYIIGKDGRCVKPCNVAYCLTYAKNCHCKKCKPGYVLLHGKCKGNYSGRTSQSHSKATGQGERLNTQPATYLMYQIPGYRGDSGRGQYLVYWWPRLLSG